MSINGVTAKIVGLRRHTVKLALVLAALFVVPFVGFSGTAYAAFADCSAGNLCVWRDSNGAGIRTSWGGSWRNTCWNMIESSDNKISSVYNRLSVKVTFYDEKNCVSSAPAWKFDINPGVSASAGGGTFPDLMNDRISSVRFY